MILAFTSIVTFLICTGPLVQDDAPINFGATDTGGARWIYSQTNEKHFGVRVPKKPKGPIWPADEDQPPLSATRAIQHAIKKRAELIPDDDDFVWGVATASLVPWNATDGYWYWEINFERCPRDGVDTNSEENLRLVILMDGTVIEPRVENSRQ